MRFLLLLALCGLPAFTLSGCGPGTEENDAKTWSDAETAANAYLGLLKAMAWEDAYKMHSGSNAPFNVQGSKAFARSMNDYQRGWPGVFGFDYTLERETLGARSMLASFKVHIKYPGGSFPNAAPGALEASGGKQPAINPEMRLNMEKTGTEWKISRFGDSRDVKDQPEAGKPQAK